jgi:hypothetical protein
MKEHWHSIKQLMRQEVTQAMVVPANANFPASKFSASWDMPRPRRSSPNGRRFPPRAARLALSTTALLRPAVLCFWLHG